MVTIKKICKLAYKALQEVGFEDYTELPKGFVLYALSPMKIRISKHNKKSGKTTDVYFHDCITLIRYAVKKVGFNPQIDTLRFTRAIHKNHVKHVTYDNLEEQHKKEEQEFDSDE